MPHLGFFELAMVLAVLIALFAGLGRWSAACGGKRPTIRREQRGGLEVLMEVLGPERTRVKVATPAYPIGLHLSVPAGATLQGAFGEAGAPADVVHALLDARLRRDLFRLRPLSMRIERGEVVLEWPELLEHKTTIVQAFDLAARIALRLPEAFAQADEELLQKAPRHGDPYRPAIDASALPGARRAREREVERYLDDRRAPLAGLAVLAALGLLCGLPWVVAALL